MKRFGPERTYSYSSSVTETGSSQLSFMHSQMKSEKEALPAMSSIRSLTSRKRLSFRAARSRRRSRSGCSAIVWFLRSSLAVPSREGDHGHRAEQLPGLRGTRGDRLGLLE